MKKITITIVFISLSIIAVFAIIYVADEGDNTLSKVSSSITAISGIISLFTLGIAILLYERFGLDSKFIERKADTVIELSNILKDLKIYAVVNEKRFMLHNLIFDIHKRKDSVLKDLLNRQILVESDNYQNATKPIWELNQSIWLPTEIKSKLKFLYFDMFYSYEEDNFDNYAILYMGASKPDNYDNVQPNITIDSYIKSYKELIESIEKWMRRHTDIDLDLGFVKNDK